MHGNTFRTHIENRGLTAGAKTVLEEFQIINR
jgi:hypothetical protein